MKSVFGFAVILATTMVLSACKLDGGRQAQTPPPVRPVLSMVIKPSEPAAVRFSGTIQPRVESELSFQLLGRIDARPARVGERVKAGQLLASIDPLTLTLAVQAREADLVRAKAALRNATDALGRQSYLAKRDVVSSANLDAARQSKSAAEASLKQAEAALTKAREQLAYTRLTSEFDGVVTRVSAEVGQTVSAGQKVITVARTDLRDAVIDLPETEIATTSLGGLFEVQLQSNPLVSSSGKVREISPQADPATRTYRLRISLGGNVEAFLLGATVWATRMSVGQTNQLRIPATAVLKRNGSTHLWIVDPTNNTVRTVEIELGQGGADEVVVRNGLEPGARIVIAGVNSLSEGQAVKIAEMVTE